MKKPIALVCGLLCATLLVFGLVCTANAATVVLDPLNDDTAIGMRNLQVGNTLYNMAFIRGSAADVYGGFPGVFPFGDSGAAAAAVDAANGALNDYNLLNATDVTRVGFAVASGSPAWLLAYDSQAGIPPSPDTATVWRSGYDGIYGGAPDTWERDTTGVFGAGYDGTSTYAAFQVVPLPAAVWLLGSGLLGVLGLRRKRSNT